MLTLNITGRLALPEAEDVGEAKAERRERDEEGRQQRGFDHHQQDEEHGDGHADTAHEPPEQATFETPGAAFGIGRGVGVGESQFSFQARGRSGGWCGAGLERADANGAVGIQAEDGVEGIDHRRSRRDDRTADDGHLPLVNIAATDGEAAVDDGGDAEDEAEHHDHGEAVADAGLEVGGTERGGLRPGREGVEGENGGGDKERGQPRTVFRTDVFDELHTRCFVLVVTGNDSFAALRAHSAKRKKLIGVRGTQGARAVRIEFRDE